MTKRKRRGSLLFPLALVFLGVLFLLTNLGVIGSAVWPELVRYWPVLLILLGIDTLLQRRSAAAAVAAFFSALVLIAAGIALFTLFAPETWITEEQSFTQSLAGASSAEILLSCPDCSMHLSALASDAPPETLVRGTLTVRRDERLTETVRREDDQATLRLESVYRLPLALSADHSSHVWDVELTDTVPLTLSVATDGSAELDLRGLQLQSIDLTAGDAAFTVTLSDRSDTTVYLSGANVTLIAPSALGIRVIGAATGELAVPEDYVRTDGDVTSQNYDTAVTRCMVYLRPGSDRIEVRSLERDPS